MSDDGPPGSGDDPAGGGDDPSGAGDRPAGDGDDPSGDSEEGDLSEDLAALHHHLAATEELPVDPAAARWIGEAQAVAADLAGDEAVPRDVVARRIGHVRDLLERMGDPDHDRARERVAAALSVVAAIERRIEDRDGGE